MLPHKIFNTVEEYKHVSCHSSTTHEDSVCKSPHTCFIEGLQTSHPADVCLVSRATVRSAWKTDLEPVLQL